MRENFLRFLSSETYILIFFYVNLFQTSICPFCPLEQSYHFHCRKCLSKGGIPWNWGKSWKLWRMVSPDVIGVTDLYPPGKSGRGKYLWEGVISSREAGDIWCWLPILAPSPRLLPSPALLTHSSLIHTFSPSSSLTSHTAALVLCTFPASRFLLEWKP